MKMDKLENTQWKELIKRISNLEKIAEERRGIAGKVGDIQGSLKQLSDSVGDMDALDAPNLVEGLNTILETIKIMQGE